VASIWLYALCQAEGARTLGITMKRGSLLAMLHSVGPREPELCAHVYSAEEKGLWSSMVHRASDREERTRTLCGDSVYQ